MVSYGPKVNPFLLNGDLISKQQRPHSVMERFIVNQTTMILQYFGHRSLSCANSGRILN